MKKTVNNAMRSVLAVVAVLAAATGAAQEGSPGQVVEQGMPRGDATVVPAAEFRTVVNTLGNQQNIDKLVRTVDTKGPAGHISIAAVAYNAGPQNWNGVANEHDAISEVFYITKGSATFVFGGNLEQPRAFDKKSEAVRKVFGPGRGGKVSGHKKVKAMPGDSIVLPPHTPHNIIEVTEDFEMVVIRIDPAKVLEIG